MCTLDDVGRGQRAGLASALRPQPELDVTLRPFDGRERETPHREAEQGNIVGQYAERASFRMVACDECGTEYEVVGTGPLELVRVDRDIDEDDDELFEEEDE